MMALICSLLIAMSALAQEGGDLQARIVYAAQAEDANQLSELRQNLATAVQAERGNLALHYHLAHADFRYALLLGTAHADRAERALAECVEQLNLIEATPNSVEALVLQSLCYGELAKYRGLQSVLLRSRALARITQAHQLQPRNPRVLFVLAQNQLVKANSRSGIPNELLTAAELFERAPQTQPDVPGWGHAECYLTLGHELRTRGEIVAARNWIEKALIIAPDFKAAQREQTLLAP